MAHQSLASEIVVATDGDAGAQVETVVVDGAPTIERRTG
jgi:hypothetical protein